MDSEDCPQYEFCCECHGMFEYELQSGYCKVCYERILNELRQEDENNE